MTLPINKLRNEYRSLADFMRCDVNREVRSWCESLNVNVDRMRGMRMSTYQREALIQVICEGVRETIEEMVQ